MAKDLKDGSAKKDNPIQDRYDSEFNKLTSPEHMSKDGKSGEKNRNNDSNSGDSKSPVDLTVAEKKSTDPKSPDNGMYTPSVKSVGKKGFGKFTTRKRVGIFGGVTGIIIVLVVYTLSIVSGPFQFIHIGQLLERDFASLDLMSQQRIGAHLRSYAWGGQNAYVGSRLGLIGNRAANLIETNLKNNGIDLVYTQDTGVLTGVKVDGKIVAEFDGTDSNKFRRDITKSVISERMGWSKTTTALQSRLPFKRYDVSLKVLGNLRRKADEKLQDWYDRLRDDRARRVTDTSFDYDATREKINELESKTDPLTPEEEKLLNDLKADGGEIDAIAKEALDTYESTPGDHTTKLRAASAKFEAAASAAGGASMIAMVLALSCLIDSLTEQEKTAFFENVFLPLLRMGGEAMSLGSQIQLGHDVNIDELALNNEFLYDKASDTSWSDSEGFGGNEPIPTEYKANTQETPTVLKILSGVEQLADFTGIGLLSEVGVVCSVAGNPWTGWGLFVVEVGAGILSAGSSFAAGSAVKTALSAFVKEVVGEAIAGKAISAGSNYILSSLIGKIVPPLARGALYGSIISMGSHYAANEAGRSAGGTSLTDEQTGALDAHLKQLRIEKASEKGFAYKYFDSSNPDSLTASILSSVAGKGFAKVISGLASFIFTPFANIGGILSSSVNAADDGSYSVNYGAEKIAFSLDEIYSEDPIIQDPFAAEKYVNDNNLEEKYAECLKSPVDSFRNGDYDELEDFYLAPLSNLKNCDYPETPEEERDFAIYRIHHFDVQNLLSVACLEGDDQSCTELESYGSEAYLQDSFTDPTNTPTDNPANSIPVPNPDSVTSGIAGTRDISCSGTNISAGSNIQSALNSGSSGETFCLAAGTYAGQTITPKSNQTIVAAKGTVLNGGGSTTYAFTGNANNVTIKNFVITGYNNPAQKGAINAGGDGWIVEGNEIYENAGVGVKLSGDNSKLIDNFIHHNRQLGVSVDYNENSLVEGNEISYNNYNSDYDWGWEAGGTKFWATENLVVRDNYSHHNHGPGLWDDYNNNNILYESNRVEDNYANGIFHEIGYKATIRNNTIRNNGHGHDAWLWGAGILIAASQDTEVYGNTLEGNFNGISLVQQNRVAGGDPYYEEYGPWLVRNNTIHDNNVSGGASGAVQDIGSSAIFNANNVWYGNVYNSGHRFAWNNQWMGLSEWIQLHPGEAN